VLFGEKKELKKEKKKKARRSKKDSNRPINAFLPPLNNGWPLNHQEEKLLEKTGPTIICGTFLVRDWAS
jgi:hypothetical protein